MIQRHTEIIGSRSAGVESPIELVQSTDQSWHYAWLFVAALITALV